MNESMRSVADIPGDDVEDDLSGISPELVLIDPELARLVRERQTDEASPAARRVPTLRLVEGGSAESAIVPRPVESAPPAPAAPSGETTASSVPAPAVEPPHEDIAPIASSTSTPVVVEPVVDALPVPALEPEPGPVARRVIEAEPARAIPLPEVEAPAVALDRVADVTVPATQPAHDFSTMPHPVARPATQRRARASAGSRKRGRARGILAFLVAVAVASAAVLGITRVTAGTPEGPAGKSGTAAVGAPPVAKKSAGKTKAATSTKKPATKKPARAKPKPAASKPAVTKPVTTKKTSAANAPTKPKTTAAAKPKTRASVKPKTTTAKPKVATTPPKTAAAPAAAETRRFAWAPVDGAVGYHVELFRGNDRVLAQDTKEPVLELAPSWRYQGRTVTLTPGEYRWYVWPVTASGRGTQAVVQAKLSV